MDNEVYLKVKEFKRRYPMTVAWRLKKNSRVVQEHLNPDEKVLYAFAAQKNNNVFDLISTGVVVITNKRIVIGRKRVIFGYFFDSITPDLFNDLKLFAGPIWGKIQIDTLKELITLTNLDKRALPEVETHISTYMMDEKQKYARVVNQKNTK
ncbi:MAG: PH domain-containing protein [Bacilli bacterium]|nr:PH domain-containing protein [Bacilli bacterium]